MASETVDTVEDLRTRLSTATSRYDLACFRADLERVVGTQHLGQELRDVMFARAQRGSEKDWDVVLGRYIDLVADLGIPVVPVFAKRHRSTFLEALQHVLNVHQVVLSGDRGGHILAAPRNGEEFDVDIELQSSGQIRVTLG